MAVVAAQLLKCQATAQEVVSSYPPWCCSLFILLSFILTIIVLNQVPQLGILSIYTNDVKMKT